MISQYFWPESFRINDVVTSLQGADCTVTVVTGQPNYPTGRILRGYRAWGLGADPGARGYTVIRVPIIPRGRGTALGLLLNYVSFIATASLLGPWLLRGQRYDVIFVYGVSPILQAVPAILLKWIKRVPLVIWVQDLWPQSLEVTGFVKNRFILAITGGVTRWIYRRADLILGQSEAFVTTLAPMAGKTAVKYHPNPGDLASAEIAPDRPAALLLEAGFNVVFAGNLGTAQALPTILAAASTLREHAGVRFVLVGDGSQRDWLAREIEKRGLRNITLAGRFPPDAVPGILAQASVLLASLNRSDILGQTIPSKISTYLAAGKPIIASMDGEGGRVVEEAGAGIACAAEDAEALAAAIVRLAATDPAALQTMGRSGRAYFDSHFDPHLLAQRLRALFEEALAQSSQAKTARPSGGGQ